MKPLPPPLDTLEPFYGLSQAERDTLPAYSFRPGLPPLIYCPSTGRNLGDQFEGLAIRDKFLFRTWEELIGDKFMRLWEICHEQRNVTLEEGKP